MKVGRGKPLVFTSWSFFFFVIFPFIFGIMLFQRWRWIAQLVLGYLFWRLFNWCYCSFMLVNEFQTEHPQNIEETKLCSFLAIECRIVSQALAQLVEGSDRSRISALGGWKFSGYVNFFFQGREGGWGQETNNCNLKGFFSVCLPMNFHKCLDGWPPLPTSPWICLWLRGLELVAF